MPETAAPTQASRNFSERSLLVLTPTDFSKPIEVRLNTPMPEEGKMAAGKEGKRAFFDIDLVSNPWLFVIVLIAFVAYSRRHAYD
jgi:hypothetical protein